MTRIFNIAFIGICLFTSFAAAALDWSKFSSPKGLPTFSMAQKSILAKPYSISEDENYYYLANDKIAYAVYKKTGQLAGGWDIDANKRCLIEAKSVYYLDTRKGTLKANETADKLISVKSTSPLKLVYRNDKMSFRVEKEYSLEGDRLIKKNIFQGRLVKQMRFLTHASEVVLDPNFRKDGFYCGRDNFIGMIEPASSIKKRDMALNIVGQASSGFMLLNFKQNLSFSQYRYKIDDLYCYPTMSSKWMEEWAIPEFTPTGWKIGLATHRIDTGKEFSDENHYKIFRGGQWEFYKDYRELPAVKELYKKIGSRPEWYSDVKVTVAHRSRRWRAMNDLRGILDYIDNGKILSLQWPFGDWGDYRPSVPSRTPDGNIIPDDFTETFIDIPRKLSDRINCGFYTWQTSTFAYTDVFQKHPDWFIHKKRNGKVFSCYPRHNTNHMTMMSVPECKTYMLRAHRELQKRFKPQFMYIDGGGQKSKINWETGRIDQPYHWLDFHLKWRNQARRQNPETLLFLNGISNPCADMGYLEMPHGVFGRDWRLSSNVIYMTKLYQAFDPQRWTTPLYWKRQKEPMMTNLIIGMGLRPGHTFVPSGFPKKLPFVNAAFELGNIQLTNSKLTPDWKKDVSTDLQSFTLRQGKADFVFLVNWAKEAQKYNVEIDSASIGHAADKKYFNWMFTLTAGPDRHGGPGRLSESQQRSIYKKTGWGLDTIFTTDFVGYQKAGQKWKINKKLMPGQLNMAMQTASPVLVYSVDGRRCQFWLPDVFHIDATGNVDYDKKVIAATVKSPHKTGEVIVYVPNDWEIIRVNSKRIEANQLRVNGQRFVILPFNKGETHFNIKCRFAKAVRAFGKLQLVSKEILPGKKAMFAIAGEKAGGTIQIKLAGRILYSQRFSDSKNIVVPIPSEIRGGKYIFEAWPVNGNCQPAIFSCKISAGKVPSMKKSAYEFQDDKTEIRKVNYKLDRINVDKIGVSYNEGVKGFRPNFAASVVLGQNKIKSPGFEPMLPKEKYILETGGNSLQDSPHGFAYAGLEIKNCPAKLKIKTKNSIYNYPCGWSPKKLLFRYKVAPGLLSFVIDYETADKRKYSKRIVYTLGYTRAEKSVKLPGWGKRGAADRYLKLYYGKFWRAENNFVIDMKKFAPKNWTGRVWFSLGSAGILPGRHLAVTDILPAGKDVKAEVYTNPLIKSMDCPYVDTEFKIDGKKDNVNTSTAKGFIKFNSEIPADQQTSAQIAWNDKGMYVWVECDESEKDSLVIHKSGTSLSPWADDCIQVKLKSTGAKNKAYCFMINSVGKLWIGATTDKSASQVTLPKELQPEIKTMDLKDGKWCVEYFIPFKIFGTVPVNGQVWKMNIERNCPAPDGATGESSSWSLWPSWGAVEFYKPVRTRK